MVIWSIFNISYILVKQGCIKLPSSLSSLLGLNIKLKRGREYQDGGEEYYVEKAEKLISYSIENIKAVGKNINGEERKEALKFGK